MQYVIMKWSLTVTMQVQIFKRIADHKLLLYGEGRCIIQNLAPKIYELMSIFSCIDSYQLDAISEIAQNANKI